MNDIDPMSQLHVEATILDLMDKASQVTVEVGKRSRAAAKAETEYRVRFAQEFLRAEGPMEVRRHTAEAACADLLAARKEADALLMSAQEAGRNARSRLDAARTLASNVRSAVANPSGFGS